jgi:hypothetical protein
MNEYLGQKFWTCPKCGELNASDSTECKFCAQQTESEKPIQLSSPVPETSLPNFTDHLSITPDSPGIPQEYCASDFNPDAFCWPAFWFADLWHADKGMLNLARIHYLLRLATTALGVAMVISLFSGSIGLDSHDEGGSMILAGVLSIFWFFGLISVIIFSYLSASVALKRYCQLLATTTADKMNDLYLKGRASYWTMLIVPFLLFLVAYGIMIASVSGNSENVGHVEKVGKALIMIFWRQI